MNKRLISNGIISVGEQLLFIIHQFFASFLTIRCLDITDYGLIGVAAGYLVLIGFINVSIEPILFREYHKAKANLSTYIGSLVAINLIKTACLIPFSLFLAFYAASVNESNEIYLAIAAMLAPMLSDCIVAPLTVFATVDLKKGLATTLTAIRQSLNLLLLLGLLWWPSLSYLCVKEIIISTFYIGIAFTWLKRSLNLSFSFKKIDWAFLKRTLWEYSIWTHTIGATTQFIYRSDTFFLSFFISLESLGYYNISLSSAMIANLLPGILSQINLTGLAHQKSHNAMQKVTSIFIRISLYVGLSTWLVFAILGKFYLSLQIGHTYPEETYTNMLLIVAGLVIAKTFVSPFNSYISAVGSMRGMFFRVIIPTGVFTGVLYYTSAAIMGTQGVAISNVIASLFWLGLQVMEMRRLGYSFKGVFAFNEDWQWIKSVKRRYLISPQ